MPFYDYKIVTIAYSQEATEKELCKYGDQGWKLVSVDFESRRYIFEKTRFHNANNKTEDKNSDDQGERT